MIGDTIHLTGTHLEPAIRIVNRLQITNSKFVICVGGESGCGKTTLAHALQQILKQELQFDSHILHMDDYFHLPPHDNHNQRLHDIQNVGPQEVNLDLLDSHIHEYKAGTATIIKPLVNYSENTIGEEVLNFNEKRVLIIEGTYALSLSSSDSKIFIDKTYIETFEARQKRGRDQIIPFNERVLLIEHHIISKHKSLADIVLNGQYQIT